MTGPAGRIARLSPAQQRLLAARRAAARAVPLSPLQLRLWFEDRLAPGNPAYHVRSAARLRGPLDVETVRRAVRLLGTRHDALRTTIQERPGGPVQFFDTPSGVELRVVPVESELTAQITAEISAPFDLTRGPLWRATLLELGPEDHVVVLTLHHIIGDGWSAAVLQEEIAALYRGWSAAPGADPATLLEPPRVGYADFVRLQLRQAESGELARQAAYWRSQLTGAPRRMLLPRQRAVAADCARPGARQRFSFPAELADRVRAVARSSGATVYMVLLAGLALLLSAHGAGRDVVIGTPIAVRTRPEYARVVGFFVNTLVLRVDLSGEPSIAELLARVRQTCLDGYAHQDVPFDQVVAELGVVRDAEGTPLVQIVFGLQRAPAVAALPGLEVSRCEVDSGTAQFPIGLEVTDDEPQLSGYWEYDTDLYTAHDVGELHEDFIEVLGLLTDDARRTVGDLSRMTLQRVSARQLSHAASVRQSNRDRLRGLVRQDVGGVARA